MKTCPRCDGKKFWSLSTGQKRCSRCGLTRKFDRPLWHSTKISPYWKGRLVEFFCLGVPAYRLRFQVPLNPKTVQRWFRILREAIYDLSMRDLSLNFPEKSRWMRPCSVVGCPVSVAGVQPGNGWFSVFTRGMAKSWHSLSPTEGRKTSFL